MTVTGTCPVEGCSSTFERETNAEARNSVVAHITSSKGAHEGIGYQKAQKLIDLHSDIGGSDNSDTGSEPDSSDAEISESEDAGLGLPGAPEVAQEDTDDEGDRGDEDDGLACTSCGDPLGVTDDELADAYGAGPVKLTCECGNKMEWSA